RSDQDIHDGTEQFVTCENSMGVIQASRGVLEPISNQLLSEIRIICGVAQATLGKNSKIDWEKYGHHYDNIRNDIARVIPGCEDFNRKVRQPAGYYLPNAARHGIFKTKTDKANFNVAQA